MRERLGRFLRRLPREWPVWLFWLDVVLWGIAAYIVYRR